MKYSKTLMMVAIGAVLFAACTKNATTPNNNGGNTPTPKTKKDLLVDAKWQIISDSQTISYMGVDTTEDAYTSSYADCSKDDFRIFAADGTAIRDEGADNCGDLQTESFDWALLNNDSQLQWTKVGEDDTFLAEILELTDKQMRLKDTYTESGTTYTQVLTMKNIK